MTSRNKRLLVLAGGLAFSLAVAMTVALVLAPDVVSTPTGWMIVRATAVDAESGRPVVGTEMLVAYGRRVQDPGLRELLLTFHQQSPSGRYDHSGHSIAGPDGVLEAVTEVLYEDRGLRALIGQDKWLADDAMLSAWFRHGSYYPRLVTSAGRDWGCDYNSEGMLVVNLGGVKMTKRPAPGDR